MLQYLPLWWGGYKFSGYSLRDSIKDLSAFTFHNSAEAIEITTIKDNSIQRGHTVSVISVEESTVLGRIWKIIVGVFAFMLALSAIVFFFAGGWVIIVTGVIVVIVWNLIRYILLGE